MLLAPIVKLVRAYDSVEWEIFISEWQKGLQGYESVKRVGGTGDLGRDVIGLCTQNGCEGVWDNFQCKHYEKPLSAPRACEDAGKIIFHAFRKAFAPPRRYTFVAPRRRLVGSGLALMQTRGLATRAVTSLGFRYQAGNEAGSFIDLLLSP